jgi:hypothetical protein
MNNLQDILKKLNEQTIMLSEVTSELQKLIQAVIDSCAEELPAEFINDGKN